MYSIIPQPQHMVTLPQQFSCDCRSLTIVASPELAPKAQMLAQNIQSILGHRPALTTSPSGGKVIMSLDAGIEHAEGYRLRIDTTGIYLSGKTPAGVFYAGQTLRQILLQAQRQSQGQMLRLAGVEISDQPRFAWRGLMLDVSRHFFPADQVCRLLDIMALHKLNSFHWHLTDDQGWRLPVAQYPRLTEVGAWREETILGHDQDRPRLYDHQRYGGHYTAQDIRQVVAHAAALHINIVPEIDMPGHMQAAIAAYPHLGNGLGPIGVRCHWGISHHILNPQPETVQFMQNVLAEVLQLFPGCFIHIGGDEAHKHEWSESRAVQQRMANLGLENERQLQSWFIGQMAKFLLDHGRRLIGWDEISEGGLPPDCAIMCWRNLQAAVAAASDGASVVMAPTDNTYFDYYQAGPEGQPPAIGGMLTLDKVYSFEPIPKGFAPQFHHHILGGQGQLWTEYIGSLEKLQYMAFPRACALAEVLWSPAETRNYQQFLQRLGEHRPLLDQQQVSYGPIPAPAKA